MILKRFLIACAIWIGLGLLANVFAPAGYIMVIIGVILIPIFLFGFLIGVWNMVVEAREMKKKREGK